MREQQIIDAVLAGASALPESVRLGPGDDLAWLDLPGSADAHGLLVGVDAVIAGVHFDPDQDPPELVGRKALCRNLSDVAAMAARPVACLLAITIDRRTPDAATFAERALAGLQTAARTYDCPLVGGDTAFAPGPTTLSVTVLARPGHGPPVTRAGAQPGDRLYVTGNLGGSLRTGPQGQPPRHLTFDPRIAEALELSRIMGDHLHAMMDLSDGLAMDAPRLARASGVDLDLHLQRLPMHPTAKTTTNIPQTPDTPDTSLTPSGEWRAAIGDGEDYELLFAVDPSSDVPDRLAHGTPITAIGQVSATRGKTPAVRFLDPQGVPIDTQGLGWEHHSR
ncbi:MAG: thiamine-phosphate kinase [Planctomycetota bacterium]